MTFSAYFFALFLTLLIELTVAFFLGYRTKKIVISIILINFITHPVLIYFLWVDYTLTGVFASEISILFLEFLVVFVESFLLYFVLKKDYSEMLMLSLLINASSYVSGFLIY